MSMEEADVNAEYCNPKDVKMPKMIPDARRYCSQIHLITLYITPLSLKC
jgi:hypothetical protein